MATSTPGYALRKPDLTDTVDVETDLNANWDKVDAALGTNAAAAVAAADAADAAAGAASAAAGTADAAIPRAVVDAKGDLLAATAADTVARVAVGANGRVLAAASSAGAGVEWQANPTPAPVTLTDGVSVALDASAGRVFRLVAAGDRTISAPSGAVDGREILIAHTASGLARTLTLASGAGGFALGSTTLAPTAAGTTDYIRAVYHAGADRWQVISYTTGL